MDMAVDTGELFAEFPNYWALLADKGYQGARELIRVLLP